jgi:putative transposase
MKRPESEREKGNRVLCEEIREIFEESFHIYGSRKIARELSTLERPVNHKRVARLMNEMGLRSKVCRKYKATTNSNHHLPVAENILNREFWSTAPNRKWVSDITYVWTGEGWLYVAGIMDLHRREIVGWAMGPRMTKELVIRAFRNAIARRSYPRGVLLHSDRGSQYCSYDYQTELKRYDCICSMSRKGNCYDNAPMESFWGKLKQEWLFGKRFRTREEARTEIFYYIEVFYNRKRRHAALGYRSPAATEIAI